jgi:putative membrane protein|tara:strand:+ start:97262 stop:97963 length:702 start_codon:yes stop_codon:yes gene_type:complete
MTALPYCGPAPSPDAIFGAWNLDTLLLLALAGCAWLLRDGSVRAKAGLAVLVLAYVSPLCALSAGLFSARAVHHLVIVFAAAPLLAGIFTGRVSLPAAFLFQVLAFWAWHVPGVYEWALSSDAAYWVGQAALLGSSLLLWNALSRPDASAPAAFLILIAMVMQMGLLGALITFAPVPVYGPHLFTTQQYGLSPLDDQQLAGLIMWVGSLPLTVLAGWAVLRRLLHRLEQEAVA